MACILQLGRFVVFFLGWQRSYGVIIDQVAAGGDRYLESISQDQSLERLLKPTDDFF